MYGELMDATTTINDLKKKISEFCHERDWDQYHSAKDLAIGIITESSELLEHFRFKSDKEIEEMFKVPEKRQNISEELADVFYFILRFAERHNIDLASELQKKMQKNAEKYPIQKSKGSNKKYTEF